MNTDELYTIGEVSKKASISTQTLRKWDNEGKFKADYRSEGGKRFYSKETLDKILMQHLIVKNKMVVGYCRVPHDDNIDELKEQIEAIQSRIDVHNLTDKYPNSDIITDVGTSISNITGIKRLVTLIASGKVDRLIIYSNDSLGVSNFEFIKILCEVHDTELEIIDNFSKQMIGVERELVDYLKYLHGRTYNLDHTTETLIYDILDHLE